MLTNSSNIKKINNEEKDHLYDIMGRLFFDISNKEEFYEIIDDYYMLKELNLIPKSQQDNAERQYKEKSIIYFIILLSYGRKLKLKGVVAINSICVIHNKPTVYGNAVKGIIQNHPDFRGIECNFIDKDDNPGYETTVYRAYKVNGEEVIRKYSCVYNYKCAKRAGFMKPLKTKYGSLQSNWDLHLMRRIELKSSNYASFGAFSDVFMGLDLYDDMQENNIKKEEKIESEDKTIEILKETTKIEKIEDVSSDFLDAHINKEKEPVKEENKFQLGLEE